MKIAKLMTKKLITLYLDDDLNKARALFNEHKIHHILILNDDDTLAGIITDRDLFMHLSPTVGTSKESHKDVSLLQKKIHQIMARDLVVASAEFSLHEAVLLFHDNHISCLPIIDQYNKVVGIITWRDILKVIALQYRKKQEN
jgi:acetoin utilization protein AcuB